MALCYLLWERIPASSPFAADGVTATKPQMELDGVSGMGTGPKSIHPAVQQGPRGRAAVLQKLMHKGSWGHEGRICHCSGLEHVAARGRDGALQRQRPDGLYPPCTAWHVSDVVLPSTSYGILSWPCKSTFLHTLMPSDPGHVPQYCCLYASLLAFYTFVYLSCSMQHTL